MSDLVVLYERIMFAGFILAAVFFCAAVYLFFYFNIPKTVGLLSGRTRRREIEGIRSGAIKKENVSQEDNEQTSVTENEIKSSIQKTDKTVRETDETIDLEHFQSGDTVDLEQYQTGDTIDLEKYQTGDTVDLEQFNAFENGETADLEKASEELRSNFDKGKERLMEQPVINDFVVEQEITFIHTNERLN